MMVNTPADVIDFATTRDTSKFVDAVNSILNRKAAEAIGNLRNEVASKIITPEEDSNEDV
jgi:hypothetical protein